MFKGPIGGLLALLAVSACRTGSQTTEGDLAEARRLLATEQFALLLTQADPWIAAADRTGDVKARWRIRLAKAEALLGRRKSLEALGILTKSGSFPSGPGSARDYAHWLILRAEASYYLGRSQEIPPLLDEAAQSAEKANAADLLAAIELRRGALLNNAGSYAEAHTTYRRALSLAQRAQNQTIEAKVQSNIGILLLAESRYDEAIPFLETARSKAQSAGASETAARALGNLGLCYSRLGDYDNATPRLSAAREEFTRSGNEYEVQIWAGAEGNVLYQTGDFRGAAKSYGSALAIARKVNAPVWQGRWLSNLAAVSIELKDWDGAEKYYREARALKSNLQDAAYEADSLINAAQIASGRGDITSARQSFERALNSHAEDPTVALEAHTGLASLLVSEGKPAQAELEFRGAIAEIERRQSKLLKDEYRLSWLDSLIRFYGKYIDFLMAQNQPERALEAAESSRSKLLTGDAGKPVEPAEYRALAKRSGSVLLEYWLGVNHSYVWVITPERIRSHTLPPKVEISPLLRNYRAVVAGGRNPLQVAEAAGAKLYSTLIDPIDQDTPEGTHFIIVPDGELYSLNFETLPDGRNVGRFWVERATVRISPSLSYLVSNSKRQHVRSSPRMLVIGDANSSLPQFPKLEFANQEITSIRSAMSTAQPLVVQGDAATPNSYAASQPGQFSLIHFSAHAEAATKTASALDSAVILSGPPDRCRLAARDVVSIPLTADLVTVSACRSAGGKTYGGEGLVGFAWAFMKAGASNVIAGLWDVNDRSTVELMSNLYSEMAKGAKPADALRAAKLSLIHQGGSYAKPFYWAPFQLYTARAN